MMSYFISKEELLSEIEKAVDAVFSAVGRMFSEEDVKLTKRLKELESNFLLLINTVGQQSHQLKRSHGLAPVTSKNRRKKMEEERTPRPFAEVLDDLIHLILESGDHETIILIDELEESLKNETEKKEVWKKALRKSYKKTKDLLKEQTKEDKQD